MTADELEQLERLAKAATPGPWHWNEQGWLTADDPDHHDCGSIIVDAPGYSDGPDAAYLAAVDPTTILRLLDRIASNYLHSCFLREIRDILDGELDRVREPLPEGDSAADIVNRVRILATDMRTIRAMVSRPETIGGFDLAQRREAGAEPADATQPREPGSPPKPDR